MSNAASKSKGTATAPRVEADDVLVLAHAKRMVAQYLPGPAHETELHLFYGDKDITFDDPGTFAFGERLAVQSRFRAGDCASWSGGLSWAAARPLLTQLLHAGVLRRAEDGADDRPASMVRPSPLPPASCTRARTWRECGAITEELTGRAVDVAYLELIVPVFRVAHMALDADDRQIGEANVFPRALRLDRPTTWISCAYPGTRHMVDRPMNVTALKAMRLHWNAMMATLLRVRAAFLRRDPHAADAWTVGRTERLATLVLALPTYQLLKDDAALGNGALDPVLSSLFRVTDGLRMTMHQMLFVPVGEPAKHPDDVVTPESILEYAERNYSFHSETGVCAGPRHMVEEFLRVLLSGDDGGRYGDVALSPAVEQALADIDEAFDYGLRGLQVYAAFFSLWPATARAYEELHEAVSRIDGGTAIGTRADALRERLSTRATALRTGTYLATEEWRRHREDVYADMYARCGELLSSPQLEPALPDQLDEQAGEDDVRAFDTLTAAVRDAGGIADTEQARACARPVVRYLVRSRAVLAAALRVQAHINRMLGRPAPARGFTLHDSDVHHLLQGVGERPVPFLADELRDLLHIEIHVDASRIDVTRLVPVVG